jgi:hypothetical protein
VTTAHTEALAFGLLALAFLGVSIAAFVRARHGGPRNSWRWVGLVLFVVCTLLVVGNLHGVVLTGPGGAGPSGRSSDEP